MSPALANDGAISLVALLVVLLAMMLAAVIRTPEQETPAAPEGPAGQPAAAVAARAPDAQDRAAATIARAAALLPPPQRGGTARTSVPDGTSQPRPADYAARHAGAPVPGEGTGPQPTAPGGPPWDPAPRPSATG
jgi:hypothetical protein